ncbi:hypothetical protein C0J52_20760 [Blattella germanica]|nr:hypothetical protein C0J52_20760 [Blattella germanica]
MDNGQDTLDMSPDICKAALTNNLTFANSDGNLHWQKLMAQLIYLVDETFASGGLNDRAQLLVLKVRGRRDIYPTKLKEKQKVDLYLSLKYNTSNNNTYSIDCKSSELRFREAGGSDVLTTCIFLTDRMTVLLHVLGHILQDVVITGISEEYHTSDLY